MRVEKSAQGDSKVEFRTLNAGDAFGAYCQVGYVYIKTNGGTKGFNPETAMTCGFDANQRVTPLPGAVLTY